MNNSFQDVVSDTGRSIRRIPVSRKPKIRRSIGGDSGDVLGRSSNSNNYSGRKSSRFGMWFVALISLVILYFVFSVLFSGVKIMVTPRQEAVLIDGQFSAFKEAQSGELSFEVMTVTRELSKEIPATGEEFVEEKASGKIIVYNNYSSASQKLIKNTRFETPEGLIYRIKDAVVVPGRKTVSGENVPGSLEVMVYADESGDAYNKDLLDLTIPGLKGDPRYSKFYARSKTPMTGGASGTIRTASAEDLAETSSQLDGRLRAEILAEASSVKPEGFILLNNSYVIDIDSSTSNGSDGNVLVIQRAEFKGLIFNEDDLAKFVAENTIALYNGTDEVKLNGFDDLDLSVDESDLLNLETTSSISFDLSGNTKVIWVFDKEALISDLKGQSKKDALAILARYPSILSAEVIIRPFWKRSITDNEKKIKLETIIK
jgi:hypothetical protein